VHIALGNNQNEMRVMWTSAQVPNAVVVFGNERQKLQQTAQASSSSYAANDMCHEPATNVASQYFRDPGVMYEALVTGLGPDQTYFYKVGDASTGLFSKVFKFKMPPAPGKQQGEMSFFVYGDLGDWNIKAIGPAPPLRTGTTISLMREDMNSGKHNYVAAMHDGDLSYAMGRTYLWDQFGELIQPVAAELPYMVANGNHEYCHTSGGDKDPSGAPGNGFHPPEGNYKRDSQGECSVPTNKRFHMPDNGNRLFWYSTEMGLVHHTVISSEHDYTPGSPMYQWLERDLANVNRQKTPWLFLHLHRPMYCSEVYDSDYKVSLFIRRNIEELLGKYKVDAVFSGHYHAYERTCPVYKEQCRAEKLTSGSSSGLEKALAPVHIMVGSAGAEVDNTGYYDVPWRAAAQMEYGYGRVHVYNATHTLYEFMRNKDRQIADSHWIISDHNWRV
jgi:hypothetical protein